MGSTIDSRLDKLEKLLAPSINKRPYVCYTEGKETKVEAVLKWNTEHHTDFPVDYFDEFVVQIISEKQPS